MKQTLINIAVGAAIGGAGVFYFVKPETKTEKQVVYKDRVQTVIEEVIVEAPDGAKTTKRTTTKDQTKDKTKTHVTTTTKPNWAVSVQHELFVPEAVTTVGLHRRVFSNVYVSVYGNTQLGVSAGLMITF